MKRSDEGSTSATNTREGPLFFEPGLRHDPGAQQQDDVWDPCGPWTFALQDIAKIMGFQGGETSGLNKKQWLIHGDPLANPLIWQVLT